MHRLSVTVLGVRAEGGVQGRVRRGISDYSLTVLGVEVEERKRGGDETSSGFSVTVLGVEVEGCKGGG